MNSIIMIGIYEGWKIKKKMMMKNVFKWMIVLCCAVFAAQASVSGAPRSPNIIFFLADDLGWPDVGCYGSSFYETPAIDQLAKDGCEVR